MTPKYVQQKDPMGYEAKIDIGIRCHARRSQQKDTQSTGRYSEW